MAVTKTTNIGVNVDEIRPKPAVDREAYPSGHPERASSFEQRVDASHLTSRTVGTRASYPLTPNEIAEIEKDLEPVARGIKMYRNLPPEAREGMTVKQFVVVNAMLDALGREES